MPAAGSNPTPSSVTTRRIDSPWRAASIDTDRASGSGQSFLAGFGDTQVAPEARWEFLVQTRFGSGGTAAVLNASFATTATVEAVRAGADVELTTRSMHTRDCYVVAEPGADRDRSPEI